MQTVIQVIATGRGSLRNKIMTDPQLEKKFEFIKVWHKQPGRPQGWAKIHSARVLQRGRSSPFDAMRRDRRRCRHGSTHERDNAAQGGTVSNPPLLLAAANWRPRLPGRARMGVLHFCCA